MSCESWNLTSLILLFLFLNLLASARAQFDIIHSCGDSGNYTRNSTYGANLNTLLSSLASNITDNGFYNGSVGQNQDRANAIVLCSSDRTLEQCRSCVQTAADGLVQSCPNQKQAFIFYEYCTLRYSDEPISGVLTINPAPILRNPINVVNPNQFREDRSSLLDDLRVQAANGSSRLKTGGGMRNTSNSETIYGLVQCTPDLSSADCDTCLNGAVQQLLGCCDGASPRGARVLMLSCNIRYELYSFYNETRLHQLQVLVPPPPVPSPPGTPSTNDSRSGKKDNNTTKIVIIVVVTIVVSLVLAACGAIFLMKRKRQRPHEIAETTDEIGTVESLQYDFGKIRAATNDFADVNKLGQGGFGAVYRGKLVDAQEIAVKRLSMDSGQGTLEFKNEVLLLAKLQHRNLVKLLGFSIEGSERLLIYEFAQNASLDQFIFDPIKSATLDWGRRYKIIAGIARGLLYLHEDSRLKIIHRDLKASNILLDGEMNSKIADFGMARLFRQDETQGNTSRIVGTYGYMPPEYAMHGQFSVKSDIFSFGVLVLEIISGQRNNCIKDGEKVEDLLSLMWKNWHDGTTSNMIDPVLRASTGSVHDIVRCMHIGLLCVQANPADRPTMPSIVLMLNSFTMTLPVPSEPAFFMASRFGPVISLNQDSKESNISKESNVKTGISENDMSITELYPR